MNRKRLFYVALILLLFLLPVIVFSQINRQQQIQTEAAGEAVTFSFSPLSQQAVVPNTFTISVFLDAKTNNITGLDMTLLYNSSVVDAISFQRAGNFNTELINTINTTNGTVRFAAVNTATTQITGNVSIGTLTLKAKAIGIGSLSLQTAQVTAEGVSTALPLNPTSPANYTITTTTATPTPTRIPTPLPPTPTSSTPQPTATPNPSTSSFSLNLLFHGIGKGGDSQTPGAVINPSPLSPSRPITLSVFDQANNEVTSQTGVVTYNPTTGNFTGNVSLSQPLPDGVFLIKITSPSYLRKQVSGFITITSSNRTTTITLPQTTLIVGNSNNDGRIDLLDFNMIADCYSEFKPARACSDEAKKQATDLNDDGVVNGTDINLFIRNATVQIGD